jgi:hypothetical protein
MKFPRKKWWNYLGKSDEISYEEVMIWSHHGIIFGSSWDHFRVIMGSFSGHHGIMFGSSWGHVPVIMGSFSGHHGIMFGSSRGHLWVILGIILGSFWGHFQVIMGSFSGHHWIIFESSRGHLWVIMGSSLGHPGDHFGVILVSFWDHFGNPRSCRLNHVIQIHVNSVVQLAALRRGWTTMFLKNSHSITIRYHEHLSVKTSLKTVSLGRTQTRLEDRNHGVLISGCSLLTALLELNRDYVPEFLRALTRQGICLRNSGT